MTEEKSQIAFRLDPRLKQDFKIVCTTLDVSMEKQLQGLILQFIAKHGDKLPPRDKG